MLCICIVGVLIKWLYEMHGATIKIVNAILEFILKLQTIKNRPYNLYILF